MAFRCLQAWRKKFRPRNPQLESTYSKFKSNIEIHILMVTNISLIIIYLAILIVGLTEMQNIPFRAGFFSAAVLALLARKISMPLSKLLLMSSFTACLIFVIHNSVEFVLKGIPESYFLYGNAIGIVEFMVVLSIKNTIVKVGFILANFTVKVISYSRNFTPQMIVVFGSIILLSIIFYIYYDYLERRHFKMIYDSREESRKFQSLLSNDFPMSVVIMSSDFQSVLYSNNFFQQKFGSDTNKESIATFFEKFTITLNPQIQKFDSLTSQDIRFSDFVHQLSTSTDAFKDEDSYTLSATLTQSEEDFHYEIRIRRILWDLQPAFTVVFNDISDKQTVMALKFADEQKDKVIATVSHELRTPINGILGLLEMVKARISDEISLAYLENCRSCSNLLLYLVNSILDLSQLRNHSLNIVKSPFNINQLLEEMRTLYLFQSQQKNIDFIIKNEVKDMLFVYTDRHRLIEILINLLGNAFKFTFKGSITLQVTPDEENIQKLIFSVIDTGIGIKEEDKPKLFKMFGKIPQADKNINSHGAGLGLTIVNELVKTLNNDGDACFKVESEFEKGTTFSFKISVNDPLSPLARENLHSEEDYSGCGNLKEYDSMHEMVSNKIRRMTSSQDIYRFITSTTACHLPTQGPTYETIMTEPQELLAIEIEGKDSQNILVVDDNPFNLLAITFILEKFKYNVFKACSGEECLKMLEKSVEEPPKFDLILMDIQMPVLDGLETSKIINERIRQGKLYDVPVVALTATKLTESVKEEYKQTGMLGWLEKPLNEGELQKILKDLGWK